MLTLLYEHFSLQSFTNDSGLTSVVIALFYLLKETYQCSLHWLFVVVFSTHRQNPSIFGRVLHYFSSKQFLGDVVFLLSELESWPFYLFVSARNLKCPLGRSGIIEHLNSFQACCISVAFL